MSIKKHLKRNKDRYICVLGGGLTFAGITWIIMRGVASQSIRGGIVAAPAQGGIVSVLGKNAAMNNVSFISSYRQGPPSWVIRCLETGDVFTSQKAASLTMDIPASEISKQLNGLRDSARGYTFERICMAA